MCRMISVLVVLTAVAVAGYRLQQPFAANTPTTSSNQQLSLAARGRQSNTLLLHRLISKPSSVSSSSSRSMSTAVQSDNNHNKRTVEITVASDVTPKTTRLDVYLSTADSATYSRSFIGQLCDAGLVFVNEQVKGKSYKVCPQDVIRFEMEEKTTLASQVAPENIPLDIIYEDADIIAVSKANGMVVHPAPGTPNGTFVNALLHHIGQSAGQVLIEHGQQRQSQYLAGIDVDDDTTVTAVDSGMKIEESEDVDDDFDDYEDDNYVEALDAKFEETPQLPPHVNPLDLPETPEAANASPPFLRPGIVHRLDKGTTGVLLAGKHPKAVEKLSNIFAKRLIRKVYLAICIGYPGDTTIVESIGRSVKNRQVMCVYDGPPGKPAITHTKTIAFDGKLSVCLVRIETGR